MCIQRVRDMNHEVHENSTVPKKPHLAGTTPTEASNACRRASSPRHTGPRIAPRPTPTATGGDGKRRLSLELNHAARKQRRWTLRLRSPMGTRIMSEVVRHGETLTLHGIRCASRSDAGVAGPPLAYGYNKGNLTLEWLVHL
jgi:hypothetical protein